jgi:hypothetical protein
MAYCASLPKWAICGRQSPNYRNVRPCVGNQPPTQGFSISGDRMTGYIIQTALDDNGTVLITCF